MAVLMKLPNYSIFSHSYCCIQRLKHTKPRVGDLVVRKPKRNKHWSNESVRQKAIEKRERFQYDIESSSAVVNAEKKFSRKWINDGEEVHYDDFAYNLVCGENLVEECIKEVDKSEQMKELKIIEKRYFKKPPEVNLLTWAMKEKIRYLHHTDPETWTLERLSKGFPISEEGIKKLLKSKFFLKTPEDIHRHDEKVAEKWKKMGKIGGPIGVNGMKVDESSQLALVKNGENRQNVRSKKIGMFTSLLLKLNPDENRNEMKNLNLYDDREREDSAEKLSNEAEMGKYHKRKDEFDGKRSRKVRENEITAEQFRKSQGIISNPKDNVNSEKKIETKVDLESFEYVGKYKNYKERQNSTKIEVKRGIFDSKTGLIQDGDTFYDENGEFLYRIPRFKE